MPSDETLKWTSVAMGGVAVEKVAVIALDSASGPVRLSMSTVAMYSTLHAVRGVQQHNTTVQYITHQRCASSYTDRPLRSSSHSVETVSIKVLSHRLRCVASGCGAGRTAPQRNATHRIRCEWTLRDCRNSHFTVFATTSITNKLNLRLYLRIHHISSIYWTKLQNQRT